MTTQPNRLRWVALLGVVALLGGLAYWLARPTTTTPATIPTPVVLTLAADLLPLYSSVRWSAVEAESFSIGSTVYRGASVGSALVTNTMDPASIFTPFERYYDGKLKALGWQIANELAAGGHVGGETGYRKGAATALVRYHIDYHSVSVTAPSECPCDVTLSVFSTP